MGGTYATLGEGGKGLTELFPSGVGLDEEPVEEAGVLVEDGLELAAELALAEVREEETERSFLFVLANTFKAKTNAIARSTRAITVAMIQQVLLQIDSSSTLLTGTGRIDTSCSFFSESYFFSVGL